MLDVASPEADAVAVEIRHEAGTDILIQAPGPGPHQVAARGITLHGTFAALRRGRGDGVRLTMLGGRIETPWGGAELPGGAAARVSGIDLSAGTVRLDRPLAAANRLPGRFVAVRGRSGATAHWRVRTASADGTQLMLDQAHSGLITLQGTIERVENTRVFSCGLRLPEPPRPGTPLRIGPVGDFSARRHAVAFASQTGLPLCIGGTTTTEAGPRACQIGLDVTANLKAEDVGQPFWISGIETGDDVFDDPWLAVTLDHRAKPAGTQ